MTTLSRERFSCSAGSVSHQQLRAAGAVPSLSSLCDPCWSVCLRAPGRPLHFGLSVYRTCCAIRRRVRVLCLLCPSPLAGGGGMIGGAVDFDSSLAV